MSSHTTATVDKPPRAAARTGAKEERVIPQRKEAKHNQAAADGDATHEKPGAAKPALACPEPRSSSAPTSSSRQQQQPAAVLSSSSSLLDKMAARLQGGRFRSLNETLYTCTGSEALAMMEDAPDLFSHYHDGFQQQTKGWPVQVGGRWKSSAS